MTQVAEERPVLEHLSVDSRSNLILMRWLGFLLQRVPAEELPQLLDYYRRIGWISKDVKDKLVQIAEGIRTDKASGQPLGSMEEYELAMELAEHTLLIDKEQKTAKKGTAKEPARRPPAEWPAADRRAQAGRGWQLTIEDHLRSWVFITELKGEEIDKNLWEQVDRRTREIQDDLRKYYEL